MHHLCGIHWGRICSHSCTPFSYKWIAANVDVIEYVLKTFWERILAERRLTSPFAPSFPLSWPPPPPKTLKPGEWPVFVKRLLWNRNSKKEHTHHSITHLVNSSTLSTSKSECHLWEFRPSKKKITNTFFLGSQDRAPIRILPDSQRNKSNRTSSVHSSLSSSVPVGDSEIDSCHASENAC